MSSKEQRKKRCQGCKDLLHSACFEKAQFYCKKCKKKMDKQFQKESRRFEKQVKKDNHEKLVSEYLIFKKGKRISYEKFLEQKVSELLRELESIAESDAGASL